MTKILFLLMFDTILRILFAILSTVKNIIMSIFQFNFKDIPHHCLLILVFIKEFVFNIFLVIVQGILCAMDRLISSKNEYENHIRDAIQKIDPEFLMLHKKYSN